MAIKYTVETDETDGMLKCVFRIGDWFDILNDGAPEDQEELLVYVARILCCCTYDNCFIYLADGSEELKDMDARFFVQYWRSSQKQAATGMPLFFDPETLEHIYSFIAYHTGKVTVDEVIESCIVCDVDANNPGKTYRAYQFYEDLKKYSMISPPDLVLPHDKTGTKVFYQYRIRTSPDRFSDENYCSLIRTELRDILRVLVAELNDNLGIFVPYYDDIAHMYRPSCCFVNINCNDTFAYAYADAEPIPAPYFDWAMTLLERNTDTGSASTALCSWLRGGQLPLERYRGEKFNAFFEQLCNEHGKPWEILDTSAAP